MGTIHRTLDSSSGATEATAFIQCINGREPQINEWWCMGLEMIWREVHPTDHVDVPDVTVGEFVTDYLAKSGHQILIIGQLSVNDSVQFLGFLTKPGEVDCNLSPIYWIKLRSQGGVVTTIKIRTGEEGSTMKIASPMLPGVLPLTPILLTRHGVLGVHAPPNSASATIYFITGVKSVFDVNLIGTIHWPIHGFVRVSKTGMAR